MFHRPDKINDKLYVFTPIFNPQRYRARWKNYKYFEKHVIDAGAHLVVVEAKFGERESVIVEQVSQNHTIIHVVVRQEIWLKENLMNIAAQAVDWNYGAFVDADMTFSRPDWVGETLQQLQHHPVVQMFSEVGYLDHEFELINLRLGFAERWKRGYEFKANGHTISNPTFGKKHKTFGGNGACSYKDVKHGEWGPPGGAWAYRRKEFDDVGGLIDYCILGSADWYMAAGLIGFMEGAVPKSYTEDFKRALLVWQERALQTFRKNVGVVKGLILHNWHGKMSDRQYNVRDNILKEHKFNPVTDLKRNSKGVLVLHDDGSERIRLMRDKMSSYFTQRNEDAIDD